MNSFIEQMVLDYIQNLKYLKQSEYNGRVNFSNDQENFWDVNLKTIIDFLAATNNFKFLFTKVKKKIDQLGLSTIFLRSLEPFILKNKIKYIPENELRETTKYYQQ